MLSFYLAAVDTPEEKELINRLYTEYKPIMYKISFNILKNRYDAEDAVHDTFLNIIKQGSLSKIKSFSKASTKAYITTAAKNTAVKIYKKRTKQTAEDIDEHYELESGENTEETVIASFEAAQVIAALKKLSADDYEILCLSIKNEMSTEEIAGALQIKAEAARQRIHRAKQRLLKILKGGNVA